MRIALALGCLLLPLAVGCKGTVMGGGGAGGGTTSTTSNATPFRRNPYQDSRAPPRATSARTTEAGAT